MTNDRCIQCDKFFTVDNPEGIDLPITLEYPGGKHLIGKEGRSMCVECTINLLDMLKNKGVNIECKDNEG